MIRVSDLPPPRPDDGTVRHRHHHEPELQPVPPPPPGFAVHRPRPGELTAGWRTMTIVTWAAVFFAFAGVWKASVEIGLHTWWIGPRSDPQPVAVRLIPFAVAALVALAASYNVRRLPWIGIAGALGIAVIAAFDVVTSARLAAVEFAVAGAALAVSLTSLTGQYRSMPAR